MNTMAPARAAELHAYRVRLTIGPAAAGEARGQVRATVRAWNVPVHTDVAVLLTSELVTNAVKHGQGAGQDLAPGHVVVPAAVLMDSRPPTTDCADGCRFTPSVLG